MRRSRVVLVAVFGLGLGAGCSDPGPPPLPGTLEWNRVAVTAELAEPVLSWAVAEGDRVPADAVLLTLDPRRQQARLEEARFRLAEAEARLAELAHGARSETIQAARAALSSARAAQADAESEYTRVAELRSRDLVSASSLDQALAARDQRRAETEAAAAALEELTVGTRPEQVEQAAAAVDAAKAAVRGQELTLERLVVRAPRAGIVDALPFHPGDQPPVGAELVSLLVGDAPYARVFVPAGRRTELTSDAEFEIRIEGIDAPFTATVRSVRREPSFTPYYALTGDDASRLVFRAELMLRGDAAAALPAGLPLTAIPLDDGRE